MSSGSTTMHIERDPADIFAILCDVSQNAKWASASVSGRQTSPGPVGLGTTAREVGRFMGRRMEVDSEIVEFVPDRRLAYVTSSGPFPFRGSFTVEPAGAGSMVTATFEAAPTGAFRFLGPLFAIMATRQFRRDLGNLKRLMEAGAL
jgi:uncharacterized protein YndB with AHSA1/START domain